MKRILAIFLGALALPLTAAVEIGDSAPAFSLKDMHGQTVSLADHAGKVVVLEWINPGCPFVRKFYKEQDMPKFQKAAAGMGVTWLAINSTHSGDGAYMTAGETVEWAGKHGFAATWLIDPEGTVGKAYGARTTPHMFIIDQSGKVVYQGAIDSIRDTDPASIPKAENYVMQALKALLAGQPIPDNQTRPYGCGIKYR